MDKPTSLEFPMHWRLPFTMIPILSHRASASSIECAESWKAQLCCQVQDGSWQKSTVVRETERMERCLKTYIDGILYLWELWPCSLWQTSQHSTVLSLTLGPVRSLVRPCKQPTKCSKHTTFYMGKLYKKYSIPHCFAANTTLSNCTRNALCFLNYGQVCKYKQAP